MALLGVENGPQSKQKMLDYAMSQLAYNNHNQRKQQSSDMVEFRNPFSM